MFNLVGSFTNSESCKAKIKNYEKTAQMVWPPEFKCGARGLAEKVLKDDAVFLKLFRSGLHIESGSKGLGLI